MDYVELGRRVRMLRNRLGLTQEQLAEGVGVSTSFIGHIERGEKQCSIETACRLAECLETTMDYLMRGKVCKCDQQSCALYHDLIELLSAYGGH